jgi:hypothetical protein
MLSVALSILLHFIIELQEFVTYQLKSNLFTILTIKFMNFGGAAEK